MSKATHPLKLPQSINRAAERLAKEDGVSLNQWIASAVAQKVGAVETAAEASAGCYAAMISRKINSPDMVVFAQGDR